jgi:hypothetical protein
LTFAQQYLHYGITLATLKKYKKRAARFVFNNYTDRTPGCVTKMVESLKWEKLEERKKTNYYIQVGAGLVAVGTRLES